MKYPGRVRSNVTRI